MINIDEENLDYPIIIEIPEDYWICSDNIEYSFVKNVNK